VWYGINGSIVGVVVDLVAPCYIVLQCPLVAQIVNDHGLLLLLSSVTESIVAHIVNYYGLLHSLRVVMVENFSLCSTMYITGGRLWCLLGSCMYYIALHSILNFCRCTA
jgi:hypothetical protein